MAHAITTRSGLNYNPPKNPLEEINDTQNKTTEDLSTKNEGTPDSQRNITETSAPPIPFPRRLKKEKEKEQFQKFFENLQRLSVNIPFIKALEQIPKYVKFMKDLLAQRGRGNEASKITLNERCSSVVLNKIPLKENDPGMFLRLNLGELKPTRMCIELANKSTQIPKGIVENVIVKIDRFFFPVNFVLLDMKEDHKIHIILGRPFLATAYAMIDVFNKKISFKVGDETITFDIEKSIRFPHSDDDTYHSVDMIDLSILDYVQEILPLEPFDSFLFEPINHHLPTKINSLWDDNEGEQDLINQISRNLEPESEGYTKPTLFAVNMFEGEKPTTKLKDLPSHLEYAFLGNNQEFLVIISSLLSTQEKELLFGVLAKHKSALAWKVTDIRLNPKVQDIVKAEIVKLLDAGLIYAIFDSPWVSPIHVVPKREESQLLQTKTTNLFQPAPSLGGGRIPFGLCNAPAIFQRCMTAIFHDMCKDFMEVFMDDFSVFGNSFDSCLNNLSKMLASDYAMGAVLGQRVDKKFRPIYYASKTMNDAQEHYTTTEKELLAVVYAFEKFRSYLIMSKTEFTIKIKDKKGSENLAADHLSRLENPELEELDEDAIRDSFPDEHLMVINIKEAETNPCYADYANFLVSKIVPQHLTCHLRKKFLSDVKKYIWDDPYLFKSCPDGIVRRYVFGKKLHEILEHCHTGPTRGHYGADITARKVFESGFYWPTIFKDSARTVNRNKKEWSDKLDDALGAFRNESDKAPIGSTPFRIYLTGKIEALFRQFDINHPTAVPRGEQDLQSSKNSTRSSREITLILLLYLIVHKPLLLWFRWISFDYRLPLGFGSIAGGLDHVNPIIRLPIENGISKGTRVIRLVLGIVRINHYDLVALPS
ncbi:reverse transcriptase domain-containing protein [Tanacetum coccineum]